MAALGNLPSWVSVSPRDFVLATQAGVQAGHAIADSVSRAWEENQRMQMANQRAEEEGQQNDIRNAMAQLAADRLEQYRQSEIENRKSELGIQQQGLGLRGEGLDIQRQRMDDMLNLGQERIKGATERESDRQAQRDFRNQLANQVLDLRKEQLDRPRQAHFFTDKDGIQYMVAPGSTNAVPVNLPKKEEVPSASIMDTLGNAYKNIMGLGAKVSGLSNFLPQSPAAPTAPSDVGLSYAPQETQAAPDPVAVSAPTVSEVIRTTKDGRKAVFDANSKKFIRYADQ